MLEETHILTLGKEQNGKLISVRVSGKLRTEDYGTFVPAIDEEIAKHGKVRILFELIDFRGWTMGALWADTKFAVKHFSKISRVAIVGDKRWEKGMAAFCKPFTSAKVRYFDLSDKATAQSWLREGLPAEAVANS